MKFLSPRAFLVLTIFGAATFGVFAQAGPPPEDVAQADGGARRPNLLQDLGLRQDQIRQIRQMNRERKPLMDAAQQRLREANRDLDMAIYGDSLDEAAVQDRLREFQQAQGDGIAVKTIG